MKHLYQYFMGLGMLLLVAEPYFVGKYVIGLDFSQNSFLLCYFWSVAIQFFVITTIALPYKIGELFMNNPKKKKK